jgi:hypothetical protein
MAGGRKTGGRQAGTPNASTLTLREQVEQAAGGPLPVLLATLGRQAMDKGDTHLAVTAYAKAAAYVYPRMQSSPPIGIDVVFGDRGLVPPLIVTNGTATLRAEHCKHWPGPTIHIDSQAIDAPDNT